MRMTVIPVSEVTVLRLSERPCRDMVPGARTIEGYYQLVP